MKTVLVGAAGFMVVSMLGAQGAEAAGRAKAKYKPDQLICESRDLIGSRLKRVRVCHTAQEWEEVRSQEKVGLMRKQYVGGNSGGGVTPKDTPW